MKIQPSPFLRSEFGALRVHKKWQNITYNNAIYYIFCRGMSIYDKIYKIKEEYRMKKI